MTALGDARAYSVGIVLCCFFILTCWIAVQKVFSLLAGFFGLWSFGFTGGYRGELGVADHFRILLSAAIPVLGIIGILWGVKKLFKGAGNYKQFTLIVGVALTPITFFLFLLWLLGNSSAEFVSLVGFFCITTFILFLHTSLFGIMHLSSRNAFLLVPTLLVANVFFMTVIF
ncbi:hypothetical protein [Altericista sp. CCNU0014]|uniref:hypothetical protein n=1 Tax=Altericista sp. CCNU0014 TaxID=3082949 RepID=UPI00384AE323